MKTLAFPLPLFSYSTALSVVLLTLQSNVRGQSDDFNDGNSVSGSTLPGLAQRGMVDLTFDPGSATDGPVDAIAEQSDGKIIIGGEFSIADRELRSRIARLNADGSVDRSFGAGLSGANNTVTCLAVQTDGSVLIGGEFTVVNGQTRNYIARLKADGSLDTNFGNGLAGPNGPVDSMAIQSDGKLLIGGLFTTVNGTPRGNVARLNSDGSLDNDFGDGLAGTSAEVLAVVLQNDGKALIAGSFITVNGVTRNRVARLNPNGSLDESFGGFAPDLQVLSMALQADGKIIIGGYFTATRKNIARLNADGSLDESFTNFLSGFGFTAIASINIQTDGLVLIGGNFTSVDGKDRNFVARLNSDGAVDDAFGNGLSGANGPVSAVLAQSGGQVLVGGRFTTLNDQEKNYFGRLDVSGSLDTGFTSGPSGVNGRVWPIAVQGDGKIVIGGQFWNVNGIVRTNIARLNADGSLDTTFQNGMSGVRYPDNAAVASLALRSDGKVFVGGTFTLVNGVPRRDLALLNTNGSVDTNFLGNLIGPEGAVLSIVPQGNGKVLIGGEFTSVNAFQHLNRIARLNGDGSVDTSFGFGLGGADDRVTSVAVQSNGKILIGGWFTHVNGVTRNRVARLNADGTLDTTFGAGLTGASFIVLSLAPQSDGKLLIGGLFTSVNGATRNRIARLNADGSLDMGFGAGLSGVDGAVWSVAVAGDGKILIGGEFATVNGASKRGIARLNTDGSLDTTFEIDLLGANTNVLSVVIQPDQKILIGGDLTAVNNVARRHVARLYGDLFPPSILAQPQSLTNIVGGTATFNVIAFANPAPSYQWTKDGLPLTDGGSVSGATTASLTISPVQFADAGDYAVIVSNSMGVVTSATATLRVNHPPVAQPQLVLLDEDTTAAVTLVGTDLDGDPLTFSIVTPPAHGVLDGTPPNLIYTPDTNYFGPDGFAFKVNDGLEDSVPAIVSIVVNAPPLADASATIKLVLSPNDTNATVILDGSRSFDLDGDLLQYRWFLAGSTNPLASGAVAIVVLPVGTNSITLSVSDGKDTASQTITIEVITGAQAVQRLVAAVNSDVSTSRPLIASLRAAIASIDRSNPTAAINQLQAFQNQVRAQVEPLDSALAQDLIQTAQAVIDTLNNGTPGMAAVGNARFERLVCRANGKVWMQLSAAPGKVQVVAASTNLMDWELIGVAVDRGDGSFEFEDSSAGHFAARFYRIVSP